MCVWSVRGVGKISYTHRLPWCRGVGEVCRGEVFYVCVIIVLQVTVELSYCTYIIHMYSVFTKV